MSTTKNRLVKEIKGFGDAHRNFQSNTRARASFWTKDRQKGGRLSTNVNVESRPKMKGNERLSPFRMATNGNVRALKMSANDSIRCGRTALVMMTNEPIAAVKICQDWWARGRANQNMAMCAPVGFEASRCPAR